MSDRAEIEYSSGNVFADLGLPDPDVHLAKAEIARQLAALIRARGESQQAIAEVLGLDQPKVSALLSGRISGFSLERLLNLVISLGKDVEIVIKDRTAEGGSDQVVRLGARH
jgi:predicted XRE-type DNA-binding protein